MSICFQGRQSSNIEVRRLDFNRGRVGHIWADCTLTGWNVAGGLEENVSEYLLLRGRLNKD